MEPLPIPSPPTQQTLSILYRDEHYVVINKPSGLLVHRSPIDRHETRFALQLLRDQIGQRRLKRKKMHLKDAIEYMKNQLIPDLDA